MNTTSIKGLKKFLALFLTFTMFLSFTGGGLVNAAGGSYSLDFAAANPTKYGRFFGGELAPREGRQSDPIPGARFSDGVESLMPQDMMMGQIVPFEVEISVNGSTAPENGEILLTFSFATQLSNGGNFGFDPAWRIHSAFIDTSESTDPGNNATASVVSENIASFPSGQEYIEGVIRVSGLDNGDKAILEIWVVLMDHIPPGVNLSSNIQSRIIMAETANGDSISVGKQTVPLLNPGDFLTVDTDVKVVKTDNPDPIYAGQTLTYTIHVSNLTKVAANGVVVTDTLDPNVTFVSASDGGTAAGQVVTWPAFNLGPNYTPATPDPNSMKELTVTVLVNTDAPTNNVTGTNPDNRGGHAFVALNPLADILNKVAIAVTITDDINPDNDTWQEPTNVIGATGSVTIGGTKTLEGRPPKAGEFTFELYEGAYSPEKTPIRTTTNLLNGSYSFAALDFTLADVGSKTYTVIEKAGSIAGVEYDDRQYTSVLLIANNGDGTLSITATTGSVTANNFTNKYTATGNLTIGGTKALSGRTLNAGEFTFDLYEGAYSLEKTPIRTTTNLANGSFSFAALNYTLADVGTKTYSVVERSGALGGVSYDATVHTIEVQIADKGDGTLTVTVTKGSASANNFTNSYTATGNLTIGGKKFLDGRALKAGEFTFDLYEGAYSPEKTPIRTTTNALNGTYSFAVINYSLADVGTKTYTVVERAGSLDGVEYDDTMHTIVVQISNNGDGTLTVTPTTGTISGNDFHNTYTAEGTLDLSGMKTLNGRELLAGEFWFELYDGMILVDETSNMADGSFAFDTLTFTLDDVGTKTFKVVERAGMLGGVEYDETEYTVTVEISDNGDGTLDVTVTSENAESLDFENDYTATGTLDLSGMKTLNGRELGAGEFWFELYEGMTLIDEKPNMADGSFAFDTLTFTLDDVGTKTFKVVEKAGTLGGVEYDETEYTVTVEISDNGDGTLDVAVTSENAESLDFMNEYTAGGQLNLMGLKTLANRALAAGEFWFDLYEGPTLLQSVANLADGRFIFETITFGLEDVGTKTYTVVEKDGMLPGITYDSTIHTVTVEISDNGDGTLAVEVTSENAMDLPFRNVYAVTDITVRKIWFGPAALITDIRIQLYRNGEPYLEPVLLPVGQDTIIYEDLPVVDEMGEPYTYTADEVSVPANFRKTISDDGLTITNTFIPPDVPQTGRNRTSATAGILLLLGGAAIVLFTQRKRRQGHNNQE